MVQKIQKIFKLSSTQFKVARFCMPPFDCLFVRLFYLGL